MRRINIASYKVPTGDQKGTRDTLEKFLKFLEDKSVLPKFLKFLEDKQEVQQWPTLMDEFIVSQGGFMDYNVRDSLIEILFNPELGLTAKLLLERDDLARKIKDSPGDEILLEDAEYDKVKAAVEALHGLNHNDVQFVKRILEAMPLQACL